MFTFLKRKIDFTGEVSFIIQSIAGKRIGIYHYDNKLSTFSNKTAMIYQNTKQ